MIKQQIKFSSSRHVLTNQFLKIFLCILFGRSNCITSCTLYRCKCRCYFKIFLTGSQNIQLLSQFVHEFQRTLFSSVPHTLVVFCSTRHSRLTWKFFLLGIVCLMEVCYIILDRLLGWGLSLSKML